MVPASKIASSHSIAESPDELLVLGHWFAYELPAFHNLSTISDIVVCIDPTLSTEQPLPISLTQLQHVRRKVFQVPSTRSHR
jgi:hypothetical protein